MTKEITKEEVNECLKGSYDDEGIRRWWERPRVGLNGHTPEDLWQYDRDSVLRFAQLARR